MHVLCIFWLILTGGPLWRAVAQQPGASGAPKPGIPAAATAAERPPSSAAALGPATAAPPAAGGQTGRAVQPPSGATSSAGGAAAPASGHERRSKAALAAASPAPGVTGPADAAGGGVQVVRGSGSTSVKGLMTAVVADFQKAQPQTGVSVTYDAVGSAQGVHSFMVRACDFAVSNVPLTPMQYAAMQRPILQFPFAVSGIAVTSSLPSATDGSLRLSADALARIYMCNITRWDDPLIASLNPGASLPAHAIQPLGRLDGSGATSLFTSYLATSGSWALGSHTLPSFPPCVALVQGSDGVIATLQSRNFSVAYSEVGMVRSARLPLVSVRNAAGGFTQPDPAHFSLVLPRNAALPEVTGDAWYGLNVSASAGDPEAYPIVGLEYFMMDQDLSTLGPAAGGMLRRLALYLFSQTVFSMLQSYGFHELPAQLMGVKEKEEAALARSGVQAEPAGDGSGRFRWWYGLLASLAAALLLAALLAGMMVWWRRRRRLRDAEATKLAVVERASEAPSMADKFLPRGPSDTHGSPKPPWTPSLEEAKPRLCTESSASGDMGCSRASMYTEIPELLRSRSARHDLSGLECGPLLGRGSFGKVYKGRWRGGMVAIKVLQHGGNVALQISALRESLLCKNIMHPNIVQTYKVHTVTQDAGSEGCASPMSTGGRGIPLSRGFESDGASNVGSEAELLETWIVMSFCDQGTLEQAIRQGRFANNLMDILLCLLDIAAGMDYLHSLGIMHSDLKPANVLLTTVTPSAFDPRGCVCKLADMGCARIVEQGRTHVSTTSYGTVAYMPPEMLMPGSQQGKLNKAIDVYSFAMIMIELYTGERLFKGLEVHQLMYLVFSGHRPACDMQAMPPEYAALLQDCWATEPAERPSFAEVIPRVRDMIRGARAAAAAAEHPAAVPAGRTPPQALADALGPRSGSRCGSLPRDAVARLGSAGRSDTQGAVWGSGGSCGGAGGAAAGSASGSGGPPTPSPHASARPAAGSANSEPAPGSALGPALGTHPALDRGGVTMPAASPVPAPEGCGALLAPPPLLDAKQAPEANGAGKH